MKEILGEYFLEFFRSFVNYLNDLKSWWYCMENYHENSIVIFKDIPIERQMLSLAQLQKKNSLKNFWSHSWSNFWRIFRILFRINHWIYVFLQWFILEFHQRNPTKNPKNSRLKQFLFYCGNFRCNIWKDCY